MDAILTKPKVVSLREIKKSQASAEWYTPPQYVEAARLVMGSIELDPASNAKANETIKATRFFTEAENGLLQKWDASTLWMNAPGQKSGSGQARWQQQLITEYKAGRVKEAIMLIFNASGVETKWFQELLGNYPLCMVSKRIRFIPPEGKYQDASRNQPIHGSAFAYLGPNPEKFTQVFRKFGKVIPAFEIARDLTE